MRKLQKKAKIKKLIRNLCKRNSCILVLWADEKSSRNQRFDSSYVLLPMLFLGFLYEKWLSHIASSHFNSKRTKSDLRVFEFPKCAKMKKDEFFFTKSVHFSGTSRKPEKDKKKWLNSAMFQQQADFIMIKRAYFRHSAADEILMTYKYVSPR